MKYNKGLLFAALAVVVVCGVGRLLLARRDSTQRAAGVAAKADGEADPRHVGSPPRRQDRKPAARAGYEVDPRHVGSVSGRPDRQPAAKAEGEADRPPAANQAPRAVLATPLAAGRPLSPEPAASAGAAALETSSANAARPADLLTPRTRPDEAGTPSARRAPRAAAGAQPSQASKSTDEAMPEESITEPEARTALGDVGTDRVAEAIWISAINDPTLGPEQRRNLIEDLNEDGFPDPKNVTLDDLPLILSRMELIEGLMLNAMDEANEEAFLEAYKDLAEMRDCLTDR